MTLRTLCLFALTCAAFSFEVAAAWAAPGEQNAVFLDQVDLSAIKWECLKPQVRRSVNGNKLTVAGKSYARGVGMHANSSLALDVRGTVSRFEAMVGVDDEKKGTAGSVEFLVIGDGKVLWRSGVMTTGDAAKAVEVDLAGVKTLELKAANGGDGSDSDHADWLSAKFLGNGPLSHLLAAPPEATEVWNRLAEEQVRRGVTLAQVAPGVWRVRLGTPEDITPVRLQEASPCTKQMESLPSCQRIPIKVANIGFKTGLRGTTLELPFEPGEQFYGLGMNLKTFQLAGTKKTIRVSDDQTTLLGDSHAPAPFYVSSSGYGIYIDTARYADFYFGNLEAVNKDAAKTPQDAQKLGTSTEEIYRARNTTSRFVGIDVPSAKGVDVYIFAGPDMRQAVSRYNLFSGGGCLPPMWGLGVWYRASTELGQAEVLNFLEEFRQRKIPCDVFGLEPGWHSQAYPCSFVWNSRYPDPDSLLQETAKAGYKLNLWEHCFTHPSSPLYEPLLKWSGDYKVWGGLVPDFATADARKIFADYHDKVLVQKGVSGFKLDECDHQPISAIPWSFPERSAFPSGMDGEQMHLMIGPLYQRTLESVYRGHNQRTLGLVRASGALAAPMSFGVYSDAYDHRDYVRAIATAGFAGILWCPEVRDAGSPEELYRRLQTSVFSSVAQLNCWYLKNPMWKQIEKNKNNSGKFMDNWEEVEGVCRKLLQMRMRLLPYLYAAYADYRATGLPPTRALVMDYPEDAETWNIDDQYMFGPSLMVAPLFTGQKKRSVYLPEGDWYDFYTHAKYEGGRKIDIEKPVDEIPVFVKGGTLLPLAEPVDYVAPETEFAITITAFGVKPAPFVLYEDDGTSLDFEKGKQNRIELRWDGHNVAVRKTGSYDGPSRYNILKWEQVGS